MGMGGHEGHTDEGLVAGYSGSDDRSDKYTILQQSMGDGERLGIVANKERDDRSGSIADFKSLFSLSVSLIFL